MNDTKPLVCTMPDGFVNNVPAKEIEAVIERNRGDSKVSARHMYRQLLRIVRERLAENHIHKVCFANQEVIIFIGLLPEGVTLEQAVVEAMRE